MKVTKKRCKGKYNITLDGKKVLLYANIGSIKDLAEALQDDAGEIGLFRSELSVPLGSILPIGKIIRETNVEEYKVGK